MRLSGVLTLFQQWRRKRRCRKLRECNPELVDFLVYKLGVFPGRVDLYRIALSPRGAPLPLGSGFKVSNERLEFLGDAVLELVVSDFLFQRYPRREEGQLTQLRAYLVCRRNFNQLSERIGLAQLAERMVEGVCFSTRMKGDLLEAFFGALFLDVGFEETRRAFIDRVLKGNIDFALAEANSVDAKSSLYMWAKKKNAAVSIEVSNDPNHAAYFEAMVYIDGRLLGQASAARKKLAEQAACERVCEELSIQRFNVS